MRRDLRRMGERGRGGGGGGGESPGKGDLCRYEMTAC